MNWDNLARVQQNPLSSVWAGLRCPLDESALSVSGCTLSWSFESAFTDYDAMLLEAMKIAPWDGQ